MFGGDDVGKFGRWPDDAVGEMCPSSCRLASVTPLACIAASETRSDRFASDFRKKKKENRDRVCGRGWRLETMQVEILTRLVPSPRS